MFKHITAATAAILFSTAASALTFESGQVIVNGGTVVNIEDTQLGKNALARDGYVLSGTRLVVEVDGKTVSTNIAGKSIQQIKNDLAVEIVGEFSPEERLAFEDKLKSEGIAVPTTVEQAIANAENHVSQAINTAVGQETLDRIEQAHRDSISPDALVCQGGPCSQAEVDAHHSK